MPTLSSFDWANGSWEKKQLDSDSKNTTANICIAGDWAPIRVFKEKLENNPESVYGNLLPSIRSTDLSIVNLESPLSDRGSPVHKSGAVFKGEQQHFEALASVPFDVVTLANNHVMDYGIDAFKDTINGLNHHHIQWVGAGMSRNEALAPLILNINDIDIAIVNFSEGEDLTSAGKGPGVMGWDLSAMEDTIKTLRPKVDYIIVISHCGIEYIPFPPPYVTNAFKKLAKAGADIVIGHHPHVPQGIQFFDNIPLCYSLGNFVFYQLTDLKYRKLGYLVNIQINKKSLLSLKLIPYEINDSGLSRLEGVAAKDYWKKFKEISLPLHDDEKLAETWHGFLHTYGVEGFFNEISMISQKIKTDPQKGAAMFRNRLTTPQHFNHWKDLMSMVVEDRLETSPEWAQELNDEWLTCKKR